MSACRLQLTVLVSLCLCAGGMAFGGVPAQAEFTHAYLSQITEVPVGSGATVTGPFVSPEGLTLDGKEDLYVADAGGSAVDKFDSSGTFLTQFGGSELNGMDSIAVDDVTGDIYTAHSGVVNVLSEAGSLIGVWKGQNTPLGHFYGNGDPTYVTIDNSTSLSDPGTGNVFVGDDGFPNIVDVFKPEAQEKYLLQLNGENTGNDIGENLGAIAINETNGDVIISTQAGYTNAVKIFAPSTLGGYEYASEIKGTPAGVFAYITGISANPSTGEIYVVSGGAVYQFSATGEYVGEILETPSGPLKASGIVVGKDGKVYVSEEQKIDVFGPNVTIPTIVVDNPSGLTPYSATLNGTVNALGVGGVECLVEYGTTAAYGQSVACSPQTVPSSSGAVAVSADISGLQPHATYHYRLVVTSANGPNASVDQQFETLGSEVEAGSLAVSDVSTASATFEAQVLPNGANTHYYFQYGTTTSYGSDAPAPPGGEVGASEGAQVVSAHVQELAPDTTYHYRAVTSIEYAPGEIYTSNSADQTFSTQTLGGAVGLLDDRQYELVSPVEKGGAQIFGIQYDQNFNTIGGSGSTQAAEDGGGMTYLASSAAGAGESGNTYATQLLSTRGADGWSTQDISPPDPNYVDINIEKGEGYRLFSPDLSRGVLLQAEVTSEPSLSAEVSGEIPNNDEIYVRENDTGTYRAVLKEPLRGSEENREYGGELEFLSASTDLSHVVFSTRADLLPNMGETYAPMLYEWYDSKLHLINILPDKEIEEPSILGDENGGGENSEYLGRYAVSSDGTRVVWGASYKVLYSRDMATEETVRVDEPQGGNGVGRSEFQIASSDGTRVFFSNTGELTPGATGGNLYMFDVSDGKLTDLTPGGGAGVIGASQDGTSLYVATGSVLTDAPNGRGQSATAGADNIYLLHEGSRGSGSWSTTFVATGLSYAAFGKGTSQLADLLTRVSSDGQFLAFMSNSSPTGYDNRDANTGELDEELYEYDAQTNVLVCASCNPTGGKPTGSAKIPGWNENRKVPQEQNDGTGALYASRVLSDSGRVFFDSADELVAQDVNGREDVYEYEPDQVGSCAEEAGCTALISGGAGNDDSNFVDASASGGDVFFTTNDKLVAQDKDTAVDMYDAHVCTSAEACPAQVAASPPPCDTTDGCRAAPAPQPGVFGTPASATFSGAGNVTPNVSAPAVKAKSLTRAQRLSRALQACRKNPKRKRVACEATAKKRYGTKKAKANAKKRAGRSK